MNTSQPSTGVLPHLAAGAKDLATPPGAAAASAWVRLDRAISPFPTPASRRPEPAGTELKEAAAGYLAREFSLRLHGDDILTGGGARELVLALQMAYGGELLLAAPGPEAYRLQAQALGLPVQPLSTRAVEGWRIAPQTLEQACRRAERPQLLLLDDLNDPTGAGYSDEQVQDLAAVARRHRLLVLADHGYAPLHFGRPASIARYYPEGTVVLASPNRWLAGDHVAVSAWPPELDWLRLAVSRLLPALARPPSLQAEQATAPWLRGGRELEQQLQAMREVYRALTHYAGDRLGLAGARVVEPEGGFLLYADFEPLRESLERTGIDGADSLSQRMAAETGVVATAGTRFGAKPQALTQRYALTAFDGGRALQAAREALEQPRAELNEQFVETYCAPTAAAITAVARWLDRLAPRRRSADGSTEAPPAETRTQDGLPAITPQPPQA